MHSCNILNALDTLCLIVCKTRCL